MADPPAHVANCFAKVVDVPKLPPAIEAKLSEEKYDQLTNDERSYVTRLARQLMVKLRRSELSKSRCGKQMMAFYKNVKTRAEKKGKRK